MRALAIMILTINLSGCALMAPLLTETAKSAISSKKSDNHGTQVNTDLQIGDKNAKIKGNDIQDNTIKQGDLVGDQKHVYNAKQGTIIQNQSDTHLWFWSAVIGWVMAVVGWCLPTPQDMFRRKKACKRKSKKSPSAS